MRTMCAPARDNAANARSNAAPTIRVHAVEHHVCWHRQSHAIQALQRRERRRFARQHRIDHRTAGDARCQRSDGIEARRQRQHTGDRHTPRRGLVADDAAERRGNAARTAGIGAQPGYRHAIGNRHCGARRTAAGDACRRAIPWRARRTVVRIDAEAGERELRHVGAAHRDEARRPACAARPGHCAVAGGASASTREPAGVGSPAISNRSFRPTGMPA